MNARTLRIWTAIALIGALSVFASRSEAVPYDLAADWSDASNPNGPWAYRVGTTVLPSVPDWTPLGAPVTQPAWAPSTTGGNFLPAWFQAAAVMAGFDWQVGDVVVHTTDRANGAPGGVESGPANVVWTSPFTGLATITGGLWDARQSTPARPQRWELYVDGFLIDSGDLPGTVVDGIDRTTPDSFNHVNVAVAAGDVVELRVFRTDLTFAGSGDFVGVNLSIDLQEGSSIPEPATLALIAAALIGLAAARRQRAPARAIGAAPHSDVPSMR